MLHYILPGSGYTAEGIAGWNGSSKLALRFEELESYVVPDHKQDNISSQNPWQSVQPDLKTARLHCRTVRQSLDQDPD